MEGLSWICGHRKAHSLTFFHGSDLSFRNRHNQAKPIGVDNLNDRHCAARPGGWPDKSARVEVPGCHNAIKRGFDREIGLHLSHASQRIAGGIRIAFRRGNRSLVCNRHLICHQEIVLGHHPWSLCG